jgi:hypothetical protein
VLSEIAIKEVGIGNSEMEPIPKNVLKDVLRDRSLSARFGGSTTEQQQQQQQAKLIFFP